MTSREKINTDIKGELVEINKLFPFHFVLNEDLDVISTGPSLKKILPDYQESICAFNELFHIVKPRFTSSPTITTLKEIVSQFVLIKLNTPAEPILKGQFEWRENTKHLVFFGTLWAEDHEKMTQMGINYSDFPAYDAVFELQQMKSILQNDHEDIERLRQELSIINHSADLFLNIHASGLIRKASPSSKKILGYEPHELIGVNLKDLIPKIEENNKQEHYENIELEKEISAIIKQKKSKEFVIYLHDKKKSKVGIGISISPVIVENKEVTQLVCVIRNISNRIRDLETIRNLASFPNENPNPIFRINETGEILFNNKSADNITVANYENKNYKIEELWKHIMSSQTIKNKTSVEITVGDRLYIFSLIKRPNHTEINVYGNDVTEKILSEQRAQENFNRLNNFLESTNDVYYLIYQQNKGKNFFTSRWPLFMGFNPSIGDVWAQKRECILEEFRKTYDDAIREFQLNGSMSVKYKIKNKISGHVRWILEEAKIKFDSSINDEIISGRLSDITSNENFRSQIKETEDRFQLITESMPVMIWVSNTDNKVNYTNQTSRDFFGFDMRDLKGQEEFAEKVHPDFRKIAIDDWRECLLKKERCEMQYMVRHKSGEYRWIYEIAVPRFVNKNEFIGYIGSAFDITQEKELLSNLDEQKRKYEMISNNSADMIFLLNKEKRIEYASPSIQRILGIKEFEILDKGFHELIEKGNEVNLQMSASENIGIGQQMLSFRMKDASGELKWMEAVYNRFKESSNAEEKILVHVRDINEQYLAQTMLIENEARYRNLFSNMNLGIMEVDQDERILYTNSSFERISGYSQDELIGKIAAELFLTELTEREINIQERRNREHGKEGLYELRIKRKDGKNATWVISGAPTYDMKGKIRGSIGIHWDVTDIRALETKLLQESVQKEKELMEARLQAEEEQRDVIGRDLHDGVGQMLAYLSLYFNILKEKGVISMEDIEKAQSTILKTIDEVRRLSRNLAPPAIKDLGFREAVIELINSYGIISKPVFNLKIYKGTDPDKLLHEHKIMLFRVIQELSSNTFKYAKADTVNIKIELVKKDLSMVYEDDGIGFAINSVKKGIGLKSILSRVEFYGGNVKIQTQPGKGIKVIINLPLE
ncbi:MAG: PAS domain S-box protein [Chitinophagia bacterium]|jgi:PAS domain S-box-containing protein